MRVAIHQPNLLPWRGYFEKMRAADLFVFLDDVQFSKRSYTSRTRTREGWLSVPVHAHGKPRICDVRTAREWTDPLNGRRWLASSMLAMMNAYLIRCAADRLEFRTGTICASALRQVATPGAAGLLELCRLVGATEYLSGPSGVKYGVPETFAGSGIEVVPFAWNPTCETDRLSIIETLKEMQTA